jgi:hypothetical protein
MRPRVDNRVPTRGEVGWTHGSSRRATEGVGYGNTFMILRTSVARLRRSFDCDRLPSCVAFSPPPHGRHKLIGMSAASELHTLVLPGCPPPAPNTLVPPMIRPYPSSPKNISQTSFPPLRESLCEYLVDEKHIGLAEREIHMMVYGYHFFPKPSVHGFPRAADPADRNFQYLVQPPTVPSLARLRGYQRALRGGRGRCRRAWECTPLRGRRRCAAGGRPTMHTYRLT